MDPTDPGFGSGSGHLFFMIMCGCSLSKTMCVDEWSNCGLHENLRLPDKNDFIPTDFSLVERDPCTLPYPTIIQVL